MGYHWACEQCILKVCCSKKCERRDLIHFLCESCEKNCRISTTNTFYIPCKKIEEYNLQKKWGKLLVQYYKETSLISQLTSIDNTVTYERV